MPSLIIPDEKNSTNVQPMSISGVAESVSSGAKIGQVQKTEGAAAIQQAAKIGETQQNLGNWMASQGNEHLSRSLKAMNETIYNMVQSNAAQDYNKQSGGHIANATSPSQDGASNYSKAVKLAAPNSISGDLDNIAQNVKENYSEAIPDPSLKEKFKQSINSINENRKLTANQAQRQAQSTLSQSALSQALNSDIQNGLIDSSENIGFYASQGLDRIKNALDAGSISVSDAATMGDKLRKGLYFGSLQVSNQKDPNAVGQMLATKSAEELNLTDIEYKQLVKQNDLALKDVDNFNKVQYKAQSEIEATKLRYQFASLRDGVNDGIIGAAQIQEAYDKGKLSYSQYLELAKQHDSVKSKINKNWNVRSEISSAIQAGENLSNFDIKQIDDHYLNSIKNLSTNGDTDILIQDKINVAKLYKGPVNSFAKEIQYSTMSGNPEKIKEAVFAYNKIQEDNPIVLSGIKDNKFLAYISSLSNAYKYTSGGLDKENIQKIHDSIYNVDGRTVAARMKNFSKESDFDDNSIKKTIAEMYSGGDPWYRSPDSVSNDTVEMLRPLIRQAYTETGDKSATLEMVTNKTKALFGHTDVNNVSKWGIDAGTIMFAPPEKVYSGLASAEQIRELINKNVAPILPKGVVPDQVFVGSDDRTVQELQLASNNPNKNFTPSYYLYYKDNNGQEILLPKRWKLDDADKAELAQMKANVGESKVAPESKIIPGHPQSSMSETSNVYMEKNKQALTAVLSNTKGYGKDKILSSEFIEKLAQQSYIPQIANQYPGDVTQRPIIASALNKMVGADQDSWRVAQSVKLVNSVLLNNADPKTYLKFGTVTTRPQAGDIVVSDKKAGLFGGMQVLNGKPVVVMTSVVNGQLTKELISTKDIKGYRSLPTPEMSYKQDAPLSIKPNITRFNIYTGEKARVPTGQERFNPYDMTSSIIDSNKKPDKTVFNPATGELVNLDKSFSEQKKESIGQGVDRASDKVAVKDITSKKTKEDVVSMSGTIVVQSKTSDVKSIDNKDEINKIKVGDNVSVDNGEDNGAKSIKIMKIINNEYIDENGIAWTREQIMRAMKKKTKTDRKKDK
jgi:hypothetical protein